jgi:hypothetical protein
MHHDLPKTPRPWPCKPTDMWHVGIAHAPIERFLSAATPAITWLPTPRPFCFIADPFAMRTADGALTVFVEAFDYRTKLGEIHYYQYSPAMEYLGHGTALRTGTHLSYPYLIMHKGETYMLPESFRSGALTLYRAREFPGVWEPVATLLDLPAIDASPVQYNGQWWMFFSLPGDDNRALRELHLASAPDLLGPWTLHPQNPIRTGLNGSRMGGTPFIHEGALYLPMQDSTHGYGSGMTLLKVTTLTHDAFAAEPITHLNGTDFHADYADGMHTLSACGDLTMLDVKHIAYSPMRRIIDLQRRLKRLFDTGNRA